MTQDMFAPHVAQQHLADARVDDALEDVLLGGRRLDVLHQVVRFLEFFAAQVVDDEVEPGLGNGVDERREDLERVLAISEHTEVVPDQVVVVLRDGDALLVRERLELRLARLPVVQPEMVAGLEVDCHHAVRMLLQVHLQDLQRHVVVVQLVVAQRDVHVKRDELPVLKKQPLVDVRGLLVVIPQVVYGSK